MASEQQAKVWRCRGRTIVLDRTRVMGIVNVTPDSFSDGGRWLEPARAVEQGLRLAAEGADVLDIGGESARPGAVAVGEAEECRRVLPVIAELAARADVAISVDTRHAAVAAQALAAGACIVNDIQALAGDAALADVVRESGAGVVLMHMRGTPQTMAGETAYADVADEVERALAASLAFARGQGIDAACMVIDPGIGFAKTTAQNLALLAGLRRLTRHAPVLVGVSRKRMIGELCGEPVAERRLGGSVGAAVWCALHGASIVRVHDVRETRQALEVVSALARERMAESHV